MASDGLEAFELYKLHSSFNNLSNGKNFKNSSFDLILMDIEMPVCNGIESTRLIRQYEKANNIPFTPILAATGSNEFHEVCRQVGMTGYLFKPMNFNALRSMIQQIANNEPRINTNEDLNDSNSNGWL